MRRSGLTLLLLLALVPAAAAQQPSLDPLVRLLLRPEMRQSIEAAVRAEPFSLDAPAQLGALAALDAAGPAGEPRVAIFARLRTPAALAELRVIGAEIGTVAGDIVTARVPVSALAPLGAVASVQRIEAAHVIQRTNDVSIPLIRADRVRSRDGDVWQGYAGQRVIVGIYDSGVDYRHADFRGPDDATRLLGLWDQTGSGGAPTGFNYGLYCGVPALNDLTCPQRDNDGHGTHVAGSAAGDGSATGPGGTPYRYAGVAPAADLLVVKGGDASFAEDRIIDGIAWIFQEAQRQGRPAVVNLSLGGQYGAHDGTRLFEQAIDNLSGPGRIVVVAAGNEGANRSLVPDVALDLIHGMGVPAPGAPLEFHIDVRDYTRRTGTRANHLRINLWYAGADQLDLTVVRPDGSSLTAAAGEERQANSPAGGIYIDNAAGGLAPVNQDREALILIENFSGSGSPAEGQWIVRATPRVAASGRPLHLWFYANSVNATGTQGFTNSHVVSSPGTAVQAVTVGAFVSRLSWPSTDGNSYTFNPPREEVGNIASFSNGGPTRDGRLKPEITAPGRVIMSSLSSHASNVNQAFVAPGRQHFILQGTSMAAPHVTGAVALLLQRAPTLVPQQVKQIFSQASIRDAFAQHSYVTGDPGGIPNFQWGWGKLDVEAAIDAAGAFAQVSVLNVSAAPAESQPVQSAERGTVVPLVRLALRPEGPEAVDVTRLGFDIAGADPGARLLLIHDQAGDGQVSPQDPVLVTVPAPLEPGDTTRAAAPLELRIQPGHTLSLIAALEASGAAPHRTLVRGWFVPGETHAVGVQSGVSSPLLQPSAAIGSPTVQLTVLLPGELFAWSENPVRSSQLVLNFAHRPTVAAIYTVAGRRVIDFLAQGLVQDNARVIWDLTNDRGAPVAPGVYLAVFQVSGQTYREKLIITRPAGGRE